MLTHNAPRPTQVLRVCDAAELAKQCERLLADDDPFHRSLIWIDLKPDVARSLDLSMIEKVCEEHEGGASFLLTLQAADASFTAAESFEAFDLGPAQEPLLAASDLHEDIKLIVEKGGERYTPTAGWLAAFTELLNATFSALYAASAPVAGLHVVDEVRGTPLLRPMSLSAAEAAALRAACAQVGEVFVRVCVLDVCFLHQLCNAILEKTFEKKLNQAISELPATSILPADELERHVESLKNAIVSPPPSPPGSRPMSPAAGPMDSASREQNKPGGAGRITVRADATHLAERFERCIYRLNILTPHQREVRNQLTGFDQIFAGAGTGKSFIGVDVMNEVLTDEPTGGDGDDSLPRILFVASAPPLAMNVTKWLSIRLAETDDYTKAEAEAVLAARVHVLVLPIGEKPLVPTFSDGRMTLHSVEAAAEYRHQRDHIPPTAFSPPPSPIVKI